MKGLAIPTFLGARRRAQDSQAKSHLRAALEAEKTYFAGSLSYTDNYDKLREIENGLSWGTLDASASRSATLFCLADSSEAYPSSDYTNISGAGTWYSRKDDASSSSDCKGLLWETTSAGWS